MKRRDALKRLLLAPIAAAVGVKVVEEPKTGTLIIDGGTWLPKESYIGGAFEYDASGGFTVDPEFSKLILRAMEDDLAKTWGR